MDASAFAAHWRIMVDKDQSAEKEHEIAFLVDSGSNVNIPLKMSANSRIFRKKLIPIL